MADRLKTYRERRHAERTPEPVPKGRSRRRTKGDTFVIQQHHARRLHWDFRLERDGVLVSWAIPRGIPRDPKRNHLAVHTEDHPMEYADFAGEIPEGEYGAGKVTIYDKGTYETEKWLDDEVMVVLHGEGVSGRYVLFHTRDDDWMIHRMDPPDPAWQPMPEGLRPMLATHGSLPTGTGWGYEMLWNGVRALGAVEGGRLTLTIEGGPEITSSCPELRELAEELAPAECLLDGEIVAFSGGKLDPDLLKRRFGETDSARARRLADRLPVTYLIYDLLYLDGTVLLDESYADRRSRLEELGIGGDRWQVPPYFSGKGSAARQTSREQGLPGVVAKRLTSTYQPGKRSKDWREIPHHR